MADDKQHEPAGDAELLRLYEGTSWMYFVSRPRCEKRLFEALKAQDIPCYLPLITRRTEYSHRIYIRETPMFPNYVFASTCSQGFALGPLNSSLLKVNLLPETAARELLNDLKIVRQYELLARQHKVMISPEIAVGTPVLIRKGSFKGTYAIVEKRQGNRLITVNLRSVQMSLHVELPLSYVEIS